MSTKALLLLAASIEAAAAAGKYSGPEPTDPNSFPQELQSFNRKLVNLRQTFYHNMLNAFNDTPTGAYPTPVENNTIEKSLSGSLGQTIASLVAGALATALKGVIPTAIK